MSEAFDELQEALATACDNCETPGQRAVLKKHGFGDGCPECNGSRFPDALLMERSLLQDLVSEIEQLRDGGGPA